MQTLAGWHFILWPFHHPPSRSSWAFPVITTLNCHPCRGSWAFLVSSILTSSFPL